MKSRLFVAGGVFTICVAAVLAASVFGVRTLKADEDNDESKIRRGFDIAPVTLNLKGKNRASSACSHRQLRANDGCHPRHRRSLFRFNPLFGSDSAKINPNTYLGGGRLRRLPVSSVTRPHRLEESDADEQGHARWRQL
jgi:hypothetical protein